MLVNFNCFFTEIDFQILHLRKVEWACGELLVKELILFPQVPNSSQSYFRHWEHLAQHVHIFQVQITDLNETSTCCYV